MLRKTLTNMAVRVLTRPAIARLFDNTRRNSVAVFMLHRFSDPQNGIIGHNASLLEQALKYLIDNNYNVISLEQAVDSVKAGSSLPKRSVAFTIDDGFLDQAEIALPLFEKYKLPVTFFLTTDLLDGESWPWDSQLEYIVCNTAQAAEHITVAEKQFSTDFSSPDSKRHTLRTIRAHLKKQPLTETLNAIFELSELLQVPVSNKPPASYEGLSWKLARRYESEYVTFSPHTKSHVILSQLTDLEAKLEISHSWERLKAELKHPTPIFCYPTGRTGIDFSDREENIVAQLGMKAAVSSVPGYIDSLDNPDLFAIKRFSFPNNMTDFIQYCSWIEKAKTLALRR